MNKNFQQLWKDFANSTDEAVAVRVLAGIVADKEGRAFVSRLGRDDAEYCIYILDRVSPELRPLPPFLRSHSLVRVSQEAISKSPPRNRLSSTR